MTSPQPLDLGCSLTAAQAAYVAEQVADIASHHDGIVIIRVIPPRTDVGGPLDFAFAVEPIGAPVDEGERRVFVRIVE